MNALRRRSLQFQLTLRLGILFVAATAVAVGVLLVRTYAVTETMGAQNLVQRAGDIAQAVSEGAQGAPVLILPRRLATAYSEPGESEIFAIRDSSGDVVAASSPAVRALAATWSAADDEPRFFQLESFGQHSQDYYGLDVRLSTVAGPLSITVAEAGDADALLHAMLSEFLLDVAWIIPLFVAATLVVGIFAVRRGLAPLRETSRLAATIKPGKMSVRLPTEDLPAEIVPLVGAVNRALDRLEQGFAVQRQFTANAAHELRTPLTIITGALEASEDNGQLSRLRQDVARMNRLVNQLLRVARLDSVAVDISETVDLNRIAADVVEYTAPRAIEQHRSVALAVAERPIRVRGNRHAIEDALRNLVENAVAHTPINTEVVVEVGPDRTISVSDDGPGVGADDRQHLFERFWRGRNSPGTGAGLGLAIVQETMKAHGGEVSVAENDGGGAKFTLRF